MSYLDKIKEVVGKTFTNKESVEEALALADELKEIADEIKFQANSAKPDPDKHAYEFLTNLDKEIVRANRLIAKLEKITF